MSNYFADGIPYHQVGVLKIHQIWLSFRLKMKGMLGRSVNRSPDPDNSNT